MRTIALQRAAVAAAALAAFAGPAGAQDNPLVVRIGHAGPTSGGMAAYGKDSENGVRMAIEELNARGVKVGARTARFELLAEDDAADPKQGVVVAQKLCDAKVSGVVGHMNSGVTIPAAKVYNDCGIPHITPYSTHPQLTKLGYRTTFRMGPNDNMLGGAVGSFAADHLKVKTVAVVDDRTAYGQGVVAEFTKAAQAKGIRVVAEQYTDAKATDFSAILTAIKAATPDAVFFGGVYAQAGLMLRQMEQLGMTNLKFLGGDGICNPKLGEMAGGSKLVDHVFCSQGGTPIDRTPAAPGGAWRMRYDARFPGEFQTPSFHGYGATMVLVDAMTRAGSADPAVYAPHLFSTDYQALTARVGFTAEGEMKNPPMTMYGYRDGKRTPLD